MIGSVPFQENTVKKLEALVKAVNEVHARDDFDPGVAIIWLQDKLMWRIVIMAKPKMIVTEHLTLDMALDEITSEFLNTVGRGPAVDALCKPTPIEEEFLGGNRGEG